MLGIEYFKAAPTTYVIHYVNGAIRREGAGLSFFYYRPISTIVAVPLVSADIPFIFNETTADFQAIAIQGQLTYRVVDAKRLSTMLDFTVAPDGKYLCEDAESLKERLISITQILTRKVVQQLNLREGLKSADLIVARVIDDLKNQDSIAMLGVGILGFSIQSIKPTPETARALEAGAREELLRKADEAIYSRRNAAVEQERMIKENELNTEIAVEEKQRQIRETKMGADIVVEQQRAQLIERRSENDRKEADTRAYALDVTLNPIRNLDPKVLLAVTSNGSNPKLRIALAFQELAENAQKIGKLNISPDLLETLMKK